MPSNLSPLPPLQGDIHALIVEDHPIFADGIRSVLGRLPGLSVGGVFPDGPSALAASRSIKPKIVLLDIGLPGMGGFDLLAQMLALDSRIRALVVSVHSEGAYAFKALRLGARGYVHKGQLLEEVVEAVRTVIAGEIYLPPAFQENLVFSAVFKGSSAVAAALHSLSAREVEVLRFIGSKYSTKRIAETLHLSMKTIESHRMHINEKLGFQSSQALSEFAVQWIAALDSEADRSISRASAGEQINKA